MGKKNKNADRKKKINLVFDEAKRKDFLCGFRKRKLERKKKAEQDLQRMLKEEKKRIKQENKESYKKLVVSSRPIPDLEQLLQDEYEDENVNVKIVELSSDLLQKKDLVIGENKPKESNKTKLKKETKNTVKKIPGMASDDDENEKDIESETDEKDEGANLKTKKEVKRMLRKQATNKIKKSGVFQMKSKLDRVQNKKKSMQKKGHMKAKSNKKNDKTKKKTGKKKHK